MNTGKTLFAQLMDFLPWTTFTRIVDRYGGDHRVRTLSCAEQYRSMAFAQLTYRESLRDIETCLSVHASKLYHMGQIWIAVSVYVLVAIVKKRLDLDASLYTLLQILSVTLFEKMPIHQALAGDENRCNASQITNQLNLLDF